MSEWHEINMDKESEMNIQIREATKEDIPQLLVLYAELQPLDGTIDKDAAIAVFEQALCRGATYFVADDGGKIVATCYIVVIPNITRECSPIGFVENVVTSAAYRRFGIGRKLMDTAIKYAKEQGCYKVMLQSSSKRTEAHKFYESVGFDGDSKRAYEIRF